MSFALKEVGEAWRRSQHDCDDDACGTSHSLTLYLGLTTAGRICHICHWSEPTTFQLDQHIVQLRVHQGFARFVSRMVPREAWKWCGSRVECEGEERDK